MPLNGRSFQDLLTLVPGVTLVGGIVGSGGELTVNGQRTEANYFTVDGVSATVGTTPGDSGLGAGFAGATPGESALGTTQTMVSVDALQEFRASTSTYSAEYGRTPGGQFSFTTRSGTNDWHGSVFDYFRNEALDANNWFLDETGQPKEKERQNDFGGALGGPVLIPHLYDGKDKTFFFFSYEGLRLWTPQGLVTNSVPDAAFRQAAPTALQPVLNAFPLPNAGEDGLGDGLGIYSTGLSYPSSINSTSIRMDHNFNEKFRVFGRYANTPTVTSSYYDAIRSDIVINNRLLTVGASTTISSQQTNELRFNITQNNASIRTISTSMGGATPFDFSGVPGPNGEQFPAIGGLLNVSLNYGGYPSFGLQNTQNSQRQYNLTDTENWSVGRHNFKFGLDWRRLSTYTVPLVIQEFAIYDSEQSVLANATDYAQVNSSDYFKIEPVYNNFSSFAADEWKVTSRLSISLGLRWDINPAPGNAAGPLPYTVVQTTDIATTKLARQGTPLWHTDWLGFAPRTGLAYQLRQAPGHALVLRGGFGVFYDMGNARGSAGFNGIGIASQATLNAASYPFTSMQLDLPSPSISAPYDAAVFAFDPHLRLPRTYQWNVALEQELGNNTSLTATYVGSAGRKLLQQIQYSPEDLGNPNFNAQACAGCLVVDQNSASSDYDALQVQFQRKLSRGLQVLASYTWSHSLDNASNLLEQIARSSSDFDVRNNFQVALSYNVPGRYSRPALEGLLANWGLDVRVSARSALPVNLVGAQTYNYVTSSVYNYNPDLVPGQPLVLYGSQYPGGKVLNYAAYQPAPAGVEGDVGRNSARDFPASQLDLAVRRDFPIRERLHLQFRAEAFNVTNHPNFSAVQSYLSLGPCGAPQPLQTLYCFGASTGTLNGAISGLNPLYQIGGPRSLQLALKLLF
jgi:hypothetical protein